MKKIPLDVMDRLKLLQQLTEYRDEFIKKEGRSPEFRAACRKIGIAPQTAMRLAPTLAEKWNDVGYRQ